MGRDRSDNRELWQGLFTDESHPVHRYNTRLRNWWGRVPGHPRCKMCLFPFAGPASPLLKFIKRAPAKGNPNFCNLCEVWVQDHPGGTEANMSLVFADVRGSTGIAEKMGASRFAQLMQDFYKSANKALIQTDAWIQEPVGDEIRAIYFPVFASNHAARAIEGARALLDALSVYQAESGIEVGGGVHSGISYIGTVGVEGSGSYDVTVLGDPPNVASRLASVAGGGEMLISDVSKESSGLDLDGLEHRVLHLKGREAPLGVRVMARARVEAGGHTRPEGPR